jgi:hypothetical protein
MDLPEIVEYAADTFRSGTGLAAPTDTIRPPQVPGDFTPPTLLSIGGPIEDAGINGRDGRARERLTGLYLPETNEAIIAGGTASHGNLLNWYLNDNSIPSTALGFKAAANGVGQVFFEIPGGGGGLFQALARQGLTDMVKRLKGGTIEPNDHLYECIYAARRFGITEDAIVRYGHRVPESVEDTFNTIDAYEMADCYQELRFDGSLPPVFEDRSGGEELSAPEYGKFTDPERVPDALTQAITTLEAAGFEDFKVTELARDDGTVWTTNFSPPAIADDRFDTRGVKSGMEVNARGRVADLTFRLPTAIPQRFDTRENIRAVTERGMTNAQVPVPDTGVEGTRIRTDRVGQGDGYTPHIVIYDPQAGPPVEVVAESAVDALEAYYGAFEVAGFDIDRTPSADEGAPLFGGDGLSAPDASKKTTQTLKRLLRDANMADVRATTTGVSTVVDFTIPAVNPTETVRNLHASSIQLRNGDIEAIRVRFPYLDNDAYGQRDLFGIGDMFNQMPVVEDRGLDIRRADLAGGWAYHIERGFTDPPAPEQLVQNIRRSIEIWRGRIREYEAFATDARDPGDLAAPDDGVNFDRMVRRVRRLPFTVNTTTLATGGVTQIVDFDISLGDRSFRDENGRESEILGSTITESNGSVDTFLWRLPPVSDDLLSEAEVAAITDEAVSGTPLGDEVEAHVEPDSPSGNEWTPHIEGRTWPPYRNADALLDTLQQTFESYREGVFEAVETVGDDPKVGFGAPERASNADLFHLTLSRTAEDIAREGLKRRSMLRTEKLARDMSGEMGNYEQAAQDEPMFVEEPRDVKADRRFNEVMLDARYAVDKSLPSHESRESVFFWTTEADALRAHEDLNVIVAVDSTKLPDDCQPVKGNIDTTDAIYTDIWNAAGTGSKPLTREDEERLYETAQEYWENIVPYEPGDGNEPFGRAEVWVSCDVPPEAIEAIYDPDTGRVLYDPAEADQRTLREFEATRR